MPEAAGQSLVRVPRGIHLPPEVAGDVAVARFVFAVIFLVDCR
jgi:hypothetical protein